VTNSGLRKEKSVKGRCFLVLRRMGIEVKIGVEIQAVRAERLSKMKKES